jgi:hypothetical protein
MVELAGCVLIVLLSEETSDETHSLG